MGKRILIQSGEIDRMVGRMAHEIVEKNSRSEELVLIGIRSRGATLVQRIALKIEIITGALPQVAAIDVAPYRDDIERKPAENQPPSVDLPLSLDEKTLVLVDDVIYTGRTIRSSLDLTGRMGKPKKVLVAVLIDRGNRELPIKADVVGKNVQVQESERVNVLLRESDGVDQVTVTTGRNKNSNRQKS